MAALPDRTEDSVTRLIQIEKKKQAYTEEKRAIRVSLLTRVRGIKHNASARRREGRPKPRHRL